MQRWLLIFLFSVGMTSTAHAEAFLVWLRTARARTSAQRHTLQQAWKVRSVEALNRAGDMVKVIDDQKETLHRLQRHRWARMVEPNVRIYAQVRPNDSLFYQQWGLHNVGQSISNAIGIPGVDIGAIQGWDVGTDSPLTVAIIDSGIELTHEDLRDNLWFNSKEAKGTTGVDDDKNGFVDDINGYDFIHAKPNGEDENGHGTHVAGIIGARGNNGRGTAGVNWRIRLMPLKVLDKYGSGLMEDAVKAIDYAVAQNVRIVNTSWGTFSGSGILMESIRRLNQSGGLLVAAAGNFTADTDARPFYPASYDLPLIISVASINNLGELSAFSNYGKTQVDVAAPGEEILSTDLKNKYLLRSGTSMATPFVTGIVAQIWTRSPQFSAREVKEQLLRRVLTLPSLKGKTVSEGMARID